jgi:hypothetical protein
MARYALALQIIITILQSGASVAWLLSGDWRQFLFWLGLAICNFAYVLMVIR